jgi:hypothetical protein
MTGENGGKLRPQGAWTAPGDAPEALFDPAEASENEAQAPALPPPASALSGRLANLAAEPFAFPAAGRTAWAESGEPTGLKRRPRNAAEGDVGRPERRPLKAAARPPPLPPPGLFSVDRRSAGAEAGRFDRKRRPPVGLSDGAGASASEAATVAAVAPAQAARHALGNGHQLPPRSQTPLPCPYALARASGRP